MALACPTGGMLSAIYDMEFIVSKVGGTLLVQTVQSTFWIIFALWLPSGWWSNLEWSFAPIVLLACYGIIMLSINVLYPDINLAKKDK